MRIRSPNVDPLIVSTALRVQGAGLARRVNWGRAGRPPRGFGLPKRYLQHEHQSSAGCSSPGHLGYVDRVGRGTSL